jgi:HlyD family secretion protein
MATQNDNTDRNRLVGIILALIVAVVLFSGWIKLRGGSVAVRAEKVSRQEITNVISTNGKIEPVNNFPAYAPAPAIVKTVYVNEGDRVKPGQLLLQLDDIDARAQAAHALGQWRAAEYDVHAVESGGTNEEVLTTRNALLKAKAERDEASRNLTAVQTLQRNGAASPVEVQTAQDRMKKAEADVQLLESKLSSRYSTAEVDKVKAIAEQLHAAYDAAAELLKNLNVHAPFAGTVYQVPVKKGAYVTSGQLLVQVANLEKLQVRAFVDEPEIGRLAVGQKVEIKWDAIPGRVWQGVVTRVPSVVTMVGTRTVGEITCEIPNADRKLLPNVNVNVSIITAQHPSALTVSREAVHEQEGKRYVYAIEGDKLRFQEVQTGITSLTRVEVMQGLAEGVQVALSPVSAQSLHNGMEVKVVER